MDASIYFALWAAAIFLMMRAGCGAHVAGRTGGAHGSGAPDAAGPERLRWIPPESDIDPVCSEIVQTAAARPFVHDGTVFHFCSRDRRETFEAAPDLCPRLPDGRIAPERSLVRG